MTLVTPTLNPEFLFCSLAGVQHRNRSKLWRRLCISKTGPLWKAWRTAEPHYGSRVSAVALWYPQLPGLLTLCGSWVLLSPGQPVHAAFTPHPLGPGDPLQTGPHRGKTLFSELQSGTRRRGSPCDSTVWVTHRLDVRGESERGHFGEISLVAQWLRPRAPNAGGPWSGSWIPHAATARSCMPQLRTQRGQISE